MSTMHRKTNFNGVAVARRQERGSALVLALSLLAIFVILGTCYIRAMNLDVLATDLELRKARADQLAAAGIQVAAESLRQEILHPESFIAPRGQANVFTFATYDHISDTETGVVATSLDSTDPAEPGASRRIATATVTVFDESARVNVNHATAPMLQAVLGVDAASAGNFVSSVSSGVNSRLLSLDEMLIRGLLTKEQYDLVVPSQLTVFSVADHANPSGHLNVNEVDPAILGAALGVTVDQATQIKAKGPFATLAALGEAAAAVTGAPVAGLEANTLLGFKSRCFRVVSESHYAKVINPLEYDSAPAESKDAYLVNGSASRVEAVLLFKDDGSYEILHWSTDDDSDAADPA